MEHLAVEDGEVVDGEPVAAGVGARPGHHRHQTDGGGEEAVQTACRLVHRQAWPRVFLLGGDADPAGTWVDVDGLGSGL